MVSSPKTQGVRCRGEEAIAGDPTPPSKGRSKTIAEAGTNQSTLVQVKENGHTVQDRRKLYVVLLKKSTAVVAKGVESVKPETLRHIFATFAAQVEQAARIESGTGFVLGNAETIRLHAVKRLSVQLTATRSRQAIVGSQGSGSGEESRKARRITRHIGSDHFFSSLNQQTKQLILRKKESLN